MLRQRSATERAPDADPVYFVPIMSDAARYELAARLEFERYGPVEAIEAQRYRHG